jgi:outer membrane cobalamin receptor
MTGPWWVYLRRHIVCVRILLVLLLLLAARGTRAQSSLEVTVNGNRAITPTTSERDVNLASSVVRRERLGAPGVEAADVLRDLPGAQVRQAGGLAAPSTLGLRGANPNQTAAVIAGARLDDELTGVTDLSLFPLWFSHRIDVFRGTSPFGFDRVTPGGVLVLEPRTDADSRASVRAEAGSFGERAAHVIASSGDESFSLTAGLRAAASENDYPFSSNGGLLLQGNGERTVRRRNADYDSRDVWISTSRCTARYSLEAVANRFQREQGVPKIALLSSTQSRAETARDLWALRGIVRLSPGLELEASFNVLASSTSLRDPLRELALLAGRVDVDTLRSESGLALQSRPAARGRWRISLAAEQAHLSRTDAPDTARSAAPDVIATRQAARSAAAAEARILGPLGVHAQVAGEFTTERSSSASERQGVTELTGRAGPHLHEHVWQAWLNFTRAARPPALGERYGVSASVFGNPRLRPEHSLGLEMGARYAPNGYSSPLWLEAVSFIRSTSQAIVLVRTAQGYATPVNQQGTRVAGLEFAAGARWRIIELQTNLTLIDPRQTAPLLAGHTQLLPFQSRMTTSTVFRLRHPIERTDLRAIVLEARYHWESSRAADLVGLAWLPSQQSFDLDAALVSLLKHATLRLRMANLFNAPRYDFIGYPLPGRSVHSSLEVIW